MTLVDHRDSVTRGTPVFINNPRTDGFVLVHTPSGRTAVVPEGDVVRVVARIVDTKAFTRPEPEDPTLFDPYDMVQYLTGIRPTTGKIHTVAARLEVSSETVYRWGRAKFTVVAARVACSRYGADPAWIWGDRWTFQYEQHVAGLRYKPKAER